MMTNGDRVKNKPDVISEHFPWEVKNEEKCMKKLPN